MPYLTICLIGSGNLATHLARAWEDAGHRISTIYSRNLAHAEALAGQLFDAEPTDDPNLTDCPADAYIMAVADDAIMPLTALLQLPQGALLAHTAGARGLDDIAAYSGPKGVLYPLQTFSRQKRVKFEGIPICMEADGDEAEDPLYMLAAALSKEIYWMTRDQRLALHLAAVFACNFTNHLLTLSKNLLDAEELNFQLLKPLIKETIDKALTLGPEHSQTGPAARGDVSTQTLHLNYLTGNPELQTLYQLLSASIRENNE